MPLLEPDQLYTPGGLRLSRALFKEMNDGSSQPYFTLGRDKGELPSLRGIFIELVEDDPTEVTFAEHVFGDYSFWVHLTKAKWMQSHLEEWRLITDSRRKAKAFKAIVKEAEGNGQTSGFTAAKYLIDEPWKDKRNPKTKEAVKKSTETASKAVQGDIARMQDFMKKQG